MRRHTRRSKNFQAYFSVAPIITGGLRDGESPAKVQWRWLKKLRNRRGQNMAERYDEEERSSWGTHGFGVDHTVVDGKVGRGPGEVGDGGG